MHFPCLLAGTLSAGLAITPAAPVWASDATPSAVVSSSTISASDAPPIPLILQLRVVAGEGLVQPAGSRSAQLLTVQVTDETGRPIPKAAVSVRLPDDGATGQFVKGLKTSVLLTGPDGRASFGDVQWGAASGPVSLRITAAKGVVRAGAVCSQYVAEARQQASTAPAKGSKRNNSSSTGRSSFHLSTRTKWMLVGLAASGVSGTVAARRSATVAPAATTSTIQAVVIPSAGPAPQIGTPTLSVGHP